MNYLFLGGLFYLNYAYVDLNADSGYVADSLFYRRKIPVRFREELARDGDKYRFIFCKIKKQHKKTFEEALEELKNKMCLLGHTDYEEYCDHMMKEIKLKKESC